jgi:HAD superfamily hydrolase (TIGR01509 family)
MDMKAILFDCDGVLVDTEQQANNAMATLFSEAGLEITGDECRRRFQGLSLPAVSNRLASEHGLNIAPDSIAKSVEAALSQGITEVPGATELIRDACARDLQICVASSGSVSKMQMALWQAGLLPFFEDRLFSTSQVKHGKPAPDIFVFAAKRLNVDVADCVVIEDSLAGIRAGVSSGARVLALCLDAFADPVAAKQEGATPISSLAEGSKLLGLRG